MTSLCTCIKPALLEVYHPLVPHRRRPLTQVLDSLPSHVPSLRFPPLRLLLCLAPPWTSSHAEFPPSIEPETPGCLACPGVHQARCHELRAPPVLTGERFVVSLQGVEDSWRGVGVCFFVLFCFCFLPTTILQCFQTVPGMPQQKSAPNTSNPCPTNWATQSHGL